CVTYLLMGDYEKANPILTEVVEQWLDTPFLSTWHLLYLARLLWLMGDIERADYYAMREPKDKHYDADEMSTLWATRGCIKFSMNNLESAQAHFEQALEWCSKSLAYTHEIYHEHYVRGLAYTGLWCISGDDEHLQHAQKAYQTGRDICSAKGVVAENQQMLNTLLRYAQKSHPIVAEGLLHGE
ncbi:MAG: hypothetical protein KJ043_16550, partial [Anaerolineae bacterium]|nr:hypothetical protein [Anaerolineae bacterium]